MKRKFIMKRIAHLLMFAFLFLYGIASLFVSGNFLGSVCADEEKIVNTATLEDEFEDNKLIVVLKPEFSNFDSIDSNIVVFNKLGAIFDKLGHVGRLCLGNWQKYPR